MAARPQGARPAAARVGGLPRHAVGRVRRSRATRCAPPSPTWARCCWRACSTLNDTQAGVLQLVFKIADDHGLLLLDLKDLRAMLQHVGDNASAVHHRVRQHQRRQHRRHPARPAADRGTRRRQVLRRADAQHRRLHADGGRPAASINILAADKLMNAPRLYATFLLWMLSRAVRAAARGGRPRQAQAGVLLRRGASAVQGRARRRWSNASSWWCGWCAARAWACTS